MRKVGSPKTAASGARFNQDGMLTQSAFLGKGMVMQPFQVSPRAASQLTVCRAATQLKRTASSAGKAIKGPKKQPGEN